MSSTLTVWGTLTFPAGAMPHWLATTLDGGAEGDGSGWGTYFSDEHEAKPVSAVLEDAEAAYYFARFATEGKKLYVRAALADDYWCQWLALLGGMARAAAALGATGAYEVEDDGKFVGRLSVGTKGVVWEDAGPRDRPQDREGAQAVDRLFEEALADVTKKAAPKKKAAAKKAPAKKSATKKKTAPKRRST
jgi:hypothetical protein